MLQNINRLNRSLEEVIQVGNEFAPVESLWSYFESVMGKDAEGEQEGEGEGRRDTEGEAGEDEERDTEVQEGR